MWLGCRSTIIGFMRKPPGAVICVVKQSWNSGNMWFSAKPIGVLIRDLEQSLYTVSINTEIKACRSTDMQFRMMLVGLVICTVVQNKTNTLYTQPTLVLIYGLRQCI